MSCFVRNSPHQQHSVLVYGDSVLELMLLLSGHFQQQNYQESSRAQDEVRFSPGTANLRLGDASRLMAGGVHCYSSGWASTHLTFLAQAWFKLIWCFRPQRVMLLMMSFVVWGA